MAADLGLVAHAAQGNAHELAAQGPRDGASERGLADAGRPEEAQDGPAAVLAQLEDRQVVEDAVLDVLEVVVILVQDLARGGQIDGRRLRVFPRQLDHQVEVAAHHRGLGAFRAHLLEPAHLLVGLGARLRRQPGVFDLGADVVDLVAERILVAQLVADLAQLLAQEVVALGLGHLLLGPALDAVLHLQDANLVLQRLVDLGEPRHRVLGLQDRLRVGQLERQVGGHQVRHAAGLVHVLQDQGQLGLDRAPQLGHALHVLLHGADQALDLHVGGDRAVVEDVEPDLVARDVRDEALDARAAQPLHQDLDPAVGQLAHPHHDADRADAVERRRLGLLLGRVVLGDDEAHAVLGGERLVDGIERDGP